MRRQLGHWAGHCNLLSVKGTLEFQVLAAKAAQKEDVRIQHWLSILEGESSLI